MEPRSGTSIGTVKFWKDEKGWGAITCPELPEGKDVFAHFSCIEGDGYRELHAGQRVECHWQRQQQDSFDHVADLVRTLD